MILPLIGLICMVLGCSVCLSSVKWNTEFLNSNCVLNLAAAISELSIHKVQAIILNLNWKHSGVMYTKRLVEEL